MTSLKDVAEAAGVSSRTVNRVLKQRGRVAEETRQHVLKTVAALGYAPNPTAQSLRTGRSMEIDVLIASHDELSMAKMEAFERTLRNHGYATTVLFCSGSERKAEIVHEALRTLVLRRPAGAAFFRLPPELLNQASATLVTAGLPCIGIDCPQGPYPNIIIDRPQGVYEAVHYLHSSGRRRIAYFGPPHDRTRLDGYERAISELNLAPVTVEAPAKENSHIEEAIDQLLACNPRPDAVQVFSDVLAMQLLAELHRRGVRVPNDIAVIGFDDRAVATLAWPKLTTVAQPNREVGEAAAEALLARIENESPPPAGGSRSLPTTLVIRESA